MFAPMISIVITGNAMYQSLHKLLDGASEESVEAAINRDIHNSLMVTSVCMGVGLLGLLLVLISFFAFRYRRPWLWWMLLLAPIFPISWWYIWIPWTVILLCNRKKFQAKPGIEPPSNPTL